MSYESEAAPHRSSRVFEPAITGAVATGAKLRQNGVLMKIDIEQNQARLCLKTMARNPVLVAERLDQALKDFLQDHPHIPREEAIAMWKAAGG